MVVTGGSSGIAARFAQEGARVFITGRRQSELDKAVAAIWRRSLPASVDDPPLP